MKTKIAFILSALVLGSQSALAYPLKCSFSGDQSIAVRIVPPGNQIQVSFGFRPALMSSGRGVEPGTCAWTDREFRSGEPTQVVVMSRSTTGLAMMPVNGTMMMSVPGMPWILQAAKRGFEVSFDVSAAPVGAAYGIAVPVLLANE